MSTRSLFLGIVVILTAGTAAWFLVESGRVSSPFDGERGVSSNAPGATLPDGVRLQDDRTVLEVGPEPADALEPGDVAPSFELESLHQGTFELDHYRGRIVVLNFWATWCEPCRDEMPDLVMAQDALADDGVIFAGVSIDEEGREVVARFHETFPVDYPLLLNGLDVARQYGAHYVVPTTFVINRRGEIADRLEGAVTLERLLPRLREHVRQEN